MVTIVDTLSKSADAREARPRHPEKEHKPDNPVQRKPKWIRVKAPTSPVYRETQNLVRENNLVTVCEEAGCPNIGECWSKKHASFMILGDTCTRACAFCNVRTGMPGPVDTNEPAGVADAVNTTSLPVVAYTTTNMDDATAYALTKTYWEQKAKMGDGNAWWNGVSGKMLDNITGKIHPGAIKYYKEAGIEVPASAL